MTRYLGQTGGGLRFRDTAKGVTGEGQEPGQAILGAPFPGSCPLDSRVC